MLDIHKGRNPSIEIHCFKRKGKQSQNIEILFPGDMERQKFIEQLVEYKKKITDGQESSEDDAADEEEEDDEDGNEKEESEEEQQVAVIYD